MSDSSAAEMSVVIITPDHYAAIRKTMECLRAQTVRDRLEIVIVAPSARDLGQDEATLGCFAQVRVVEVGAITSEPEARAAGIRQASAALVARAEEHCFPEPGWAEALIAAHRGPWAAVGAVIVNANPDSAVSWANLLMDFGDAVEPTVAGVTRHPPSHNTSYKRAVLMQYGTVLAAMLAPEEVLFRDLQAGGHTLYLEPAARALHLNLSRWPALLLSAYHGGRLFGAARTQHERWRPIRRVLHAAGAPWIGLARLRHIVRNVVRIGRSHELLPRMLAPLVAALFAHGLGEATGIALGAGDSPQRKSQYELYRVRHLAERDQWAGAGR